MTARDRAETRWGLRESSPYNVYRRKWQAYLAEHRHEIEGAVVPMPPEDLEVEMVLVIGDAGDPVVRGWGTTPEAAWQSAIADMAQTIQNFDGRDVLPTNGADIVRDCLAGSTILRVRGPAATLANLAWRNVELSFVPEPDAPAGGAA